MTAKQRKGALILAAGLVAGSLLVALPSPAPAQLFDNFLGSGSRGDRALGFIPSIPLFGQPRARLRAQARPAQVAQTDYSRPPPPPAADKNAPPDVKSIVVMGDSMADWLAYGLEEVFAEAPEISVTRKARPLSSLIYNPGRHGPAGNINWPEAAHEILAKEPANFVVMIIGLADRDPIRESAPLPPAPKQGAKPGSPEPNQVGQPDAAPTSQPVKPFETRITDKTKTDQSATEPRAPTVSYDFKTEKWAELYASGSMKRLGSSRARAYPCSGWGCRLCLAPVPPQTCST